MQDLVRKGMRMQKPKDVKLTLRPCVYEWLEDMAEKCRCDYRVLARGILEDAYDRYCKSVSVEETSE